jgi:hypothetical protein
VDQLCLQNRETRWTQLLSVDARSLLRDIHQILAAFIDLIRTYCSPIMVNLKCPSMYGRIDGLREHDIVVGGVVVTDRQCKYFGIAPYRTALPCGNFEAVLPGRLWYFYPALVCTACRCHQTAAVIPTKQYSYSGISGCPFPACPFSQPPQLQVYIVGQNVSQSCSCHTN